MNRKKKKLAIIIPISAFLFLFVSLFFMIHVFPRLIEFFLMNSEGTREGIENFSSGMSSISIASCVLFTNEKNDSVLSFSEYEETTFRYYSNHQSMKYFAHEDLLLSLSYNEANYKKTIDRIKEYPGFENECSWTYQNTAFYLNSTIDLDCASCKPFTRVQLNTDPMTIQWINFVVFNEMNSTICFIGFSHYLLDWKLDIAGGYSFSNWDQFFSEFFSFYTNF